MFFVTPTVVFSTTVMVFSTTVLFVIFSMMFSRMTPRFGMNEIGSGKGLEMGSRRNWGSQS